MKTSRMCHVEYFVFLAIVLNLICDRCAVNIRM